MTTRRLLLAIPLAALFLAIIGPAIVDHALLVYAVPEMQTQFLRAYNPEPVFARFRDSRYSSTVSGGNSAGAGRGFATHSKTVDQEFVMHDSDRAALMTVLHQGMASLLTGTGAQILENSGNDHDGFHVRYMAGKSTGTVIIKPPAPVANAGRHLRHPLYPGEEDVSVQLSIEETWYKSGIPVSPLESSLLGPKDKS